jgi:hypothetical protein
MTLTRWIAPLLCVGLLWFAAGGCGKKDADTKDKAGPPAPDSSDRRPEVIDPAVKEAKTKDTGEGLAAGQSREVKTANGVVVVTKEADGTVTYKKK